MELTISSNIKPWIVTYLWLSAWIYSSLSNNRVEEMVVSKDKFPLNLIVLIDFILLIVIKGIVNRHYHYTHRISYMTLEEDKPVMLWQSKVIRMNGLYSYWDSIILLGTSLSTGRQKQYSWAASVEKKYLHIESFENDLCRFESNWVVLYLKHVFVTRSYAVIFHNLSKRPLSQLSTKILDWVVLRGMN